MPVRRLHDQAGEFATNLIVETFKARFPSRAVPAIDDLQICINALRAIAQPVNQGGHPSSETLRDIASDALKRITK